MFEHCKNVYERMLQESEPETLTDFTQEPPRQVETGNRIYEGYLTRLVSDLGLAAPYYTSIRRLLTRMQSIEQLSRGGGNAKSKWRLVRPPTVEAFERADAIAPRSVGKTAALQQQVTDLTSQMQRMQERIDILWDNMQTGKVA